MAHHVPKGRCRFFTLVINGAFKSIFRYDCDLALRIDISVDKGCRLFIFRFYSYNSITFCISPLIANFISNK